MDINQITCVKEIIDNDAEVNSYLKVGWVLLHVYSARSANQGILSHYILGWPEKSEPKMP
jgi:hypothetical protein